MVLRCNYHFISSSLFTKHAHSELQIIKGQESSCWGSWLVKLYSCSLARLSGDELEQQRRRVPVELRHLCVHNVSDLMRACLAVGAVCDVSILESKQVHSQVDISH